MLQEDRNKFKKFEKLAADGGTGPLKLALKHTHYFNPPSYLT